MTYNECFETEQFKIFFAEELKLIQQRREQILREHPGAKFKSHSMSRIKEAGHLTPEWMCDEFDKIQFKKSSCSYADRLWIEEFVKKVAWRTVLFYQKLAETAAPVKEKKPRKPREKKKPTSDAV